MGSPSGGPQCDSDMQRRDKEDTRRDTRREGRAPLALRESLESRLDINEMKDFRIYEKPRDLNIPLGGINNKEFYDLSRKQQNLKMYKVGRYERISCYTLPVLGGRPRRTEDVLRVERPGEDTGRPGEED